MTEETSKDCDAAEIYVSNEEEEDIEAQQDGLVQDQSPSSTDFPTLHQFLPRLDMIGVENGSVTQEPSVVSWHDSSAPYANMWRLIISLPGIRAPYGNHSVKEILRSAPEFHGDCDTWIFVLTTDPWTKLRKFRSQLEGNNCGEYSYDVPGVTFVTDQSGTITKKLGVAVNSGCYPAYFLCTPENELMEFSVIRDPGQLTVRTPEITFCYPIQTLALKTIANNVKSYSGIWSCYVGLKRKKGYTGKAFGKFFGVMIDKAEHDIEDSKSDEGAETTAAAGAAPEEFKWSDWLHLFKRVFEKS